MATPTPTKTELQISTGSEFTNIIYSGSTTYRTSESIAEGALPHGQTLYTRVRHTSDLGTSDWSGVVSFKIIQPVVQDVIGVCCNTEAPFWSWIDEQGNKIDAFDYRSYPTFANAKMVTFDAERAPVTMTAIPLFYIKTAASGPAGSYAEGKKCWWMSPTAKEGFRPHPAFKRDIGGSISDWRYIGTYMGTNDLIDGFHNCIGSSINQNVKDTLSITEFKELINGRNDDSIGETGYCMFDIWDLGLLRVLAIIAKCSADTQSAWGRGSTDYGPKTGSTSARIVFKGTVTDPEVWIDDLWQHYYCLTDRHQAVNRQHTLQYPMSDDTVLYNISDPNRYTVPIGEGYVLDVVDCPMAIGGDIHDLMELFLIKSMVDTIDLSPYHDAAYIWSANSTNFSVGNMWGDSDDSGLFFIEETIRGSGIGCRLAKN